jgi:antitoxin (DNA-binding transcriptional repressor) of toxin-antitoxin stability system
VTETYSTYAAKARLSEILRKVESGKTVRISRHGHVIAEVRPLLRGPVDLDERIKDLTRQGALSPVTEPRAVLKPLARRPGALARFLADRSA